MENFSNYLLQEKIQEETLGNLHVKGVIHREIKAHNMLINPIMELIHSHIAVMPESPVKVDQRIPTVISKIIMQLLLKNPAERYQNSPGLTADIDECLKQLDYGNLSIEAAEVEGKEDILSGIQSMPLDACDEICKPIVNYVHRSGKNVIRAMPLM
jgi:serine/threonine protein kinase